MTGLLIQEFKTLIKSPASISILVIPLVLLIGLGYLLPSGWIVPSSITIGIVAAVLLYFGGSIEEIKRTSFMKSISLTRLSKFTFLATKIVFAMIVSMISVLWVLLFSWIFTATPIAFLATDFSNLLGNVDGTLGVVAQVPFDINWENVKWLSMIYAGIITIVVAVSLSFIFVAFAKSSLSFYLMSFGYLLAMILFGGVVMPGFLISSDNSWFKNLYYIVPNFYTNNVMADAFSGGILNSIKIKDIYILNLLNIVNDGYSSISNALISLLHPTNLPEALTDSDINAINDLFFNSAGGWGNAGTALKPDTSWDGSLKQLDAWKETYQDVWSANLDAVYISLSQPLIDAGVKSYPVLFGNELKVILIAVIEKYDNLNGVDHSIIITAIEKAPSALLGNLVWDGSGTVAGVINDTLGITIPPIFGNILHNSSLGQYDLIANKITNLGITLNSLVSTLNDMAQPSSWYDWTIPWLEGTLFLLISIKFFKWS